jgi:malate synthase
MKKTLDKLNFLIGAGGLGLAVGQYVESKKSKPIAEKLDSALHSLENTTSILKENQAQNKIDLIRDKNFSSSIDELVNKIAKHNENFKSATDQVQKDSTEKIDSIAKEISELVKSRFNGSGGGNNNLYSDSLSRLYHNFTDYLGTLSTDQLAALCNLIAL